MPNDAIPAFIPCEPGWAPCIRIGEQRALSCFSSSRNWLSSCCGFISFVLNGKCIFCLQSASLWWACWAAFLRSNLHKAQCGSWPQRWTWSGWWHCIFCWYCIQFGWRCYLLRSISCFWGVLQKLIRDVELNLDFCYRNWVPSWPSLTMPSSIPVTPLVGLSKAIGFC